MASHVHYESSFVFLSTVLLMYLLRKRRAERARRARRPRSVWMRKMCRHRKSGHSGTLIPLLRESDLQYFFDYLRMLPSTFDRLLTLVESSIQRKDTKWRECIPAKTRLQITLRFLVSGDIQRSLSYAFNVARSAISEIISEKAQAIWENLRDEYVKWPRTPEEWNDIVRGFLQRWNIPNCIGSLGGVVALETLNVVVTASGIHGGETALRRASVD
ncbi:hypothetical protein HPB47_015068, partial [Ixodes persulcatus]